MRILIVEDEPASAEYIAAILARHVPQATVCGTAENGEEALSLLDAANPDVIITDVAMPRMDGLKLTEAVRQRYPNMAVVIISGYQEFDYARTALRFGVADYLLKPVNAPELVQCLERLSQTLPAKPSTPASDAETTPLAPLASYVRHHLAEQITLSSLCRHCGVSQTTANRIFQKYAGKSFLEFLTAERIQRACAMLRSQPHVMVKAVAASCGFGDPLYFSKVFRACVGCSPSEYVQQSAEK